MEATEYIENELKKLIDIIPQIRVRYEHHNLSDTHIVEVIPNEVYSLDEKYISWELNMWNNFVELFPLQSLCFISDDEFNSIENACLTLYGKEFVMMPTVKQEDNIELEKEVQIISQTNYCFPLPIVTTKIVQYNCYNTHEFCSINNLAA